MAMERGVKPIKGNMPSKLQEMKKGIFSNWQLYVLMLPALIYLFIFCYIPMYGVQIAFKDFYANLGILNSPWVGLEHFQRFFKSYYFSRLLTNTLVISIYELALFPLSIIFALMLHELQSKKFKKTVQTLTYAPHFISTVVLVGMIKVFLDQTTGLANHAIMAMGGKAIPFLTSPDWFRHIFVWSGKWKGLGWGTIVYLAALSGVNPELIEAAKIDGATTLQRIWYINIPTIWPTVVVLFILNIGSFMSVGFEKALLLQNNLNMDTADIIQTFVYRTGLLQGQFDFAAAVGLFDSVVNIILLVSFNWLARKTSQNSLW